ncbi:MAG: hypothetical protein O7J95_18715 [Planctomycetota bacterium]|nr:hypothetical protein [Planctomycetota bacterium]
MQQVSDYEINARVRSVLARHWVDTAKLRFGSFRGTVRLTGELHRLGGDTHTTAQLASKLDCIEHEIQRLRGVKRVYIQLEKWAKNGTGDWEATERRAAARSSAVPDAGASVTSSESHVYELTARDARKVPVEDHEEEERIVTKDRR